MQQGRSIQTSSRHGGTIRLIQALVILFVLVWPQFLLAMPVDFSDEELARMESGEILLISIQKDKPGVAMRVAAVLHSNTNEVWQVLGDCNYELIYAGMKDNNSNDRWDIDSFNDFMNQLFRSRSRNRPRTTTGMS